MITFFPSVLRSQLCLLGCGSSGGGAVSPQAEITQIDTTDHGSNQHGKHFLISDAGGRVSITMDAGAVAQRVEVDFSGKGEADFDTVAAGKYLVLYYSGGAACVWFNSGAETQPEGAFATFIEVYVEGLTTSDDIRAAFDAAVNTAIGWSNASSSGAYSVLDDPSTGDRSDSYDQSTGCPVIVSVHGHNAATNPGDAARNIMVSINNGESDGDMATAIAAALTADGGWLASSGGNLVEITDSATGARTDAADVDTGFAITVTQQGV